MGVNSSLSLLVLEGRQLLEECERANKRQENDLHGQVQTMGTSERRLGEVQQVASEGNCNVLVTSGTLIPSLVKCLLFRLNTYFHPLNSKSAPIFVAQFN
jgi:hypothetical protein